MHEIVRLSFAMVFLHVLDDFCLQKLGALVELKQRSFWLAYPERYRRDWLAPLALHGFSWAFAVHLPLLWAFPGSTAVLVSIPINAAVHAVIDHLKCNSLKINLLADQGLHLAQLAATLAAVAL